ncbi:hypothetical protein [Mycolicibacterium sp. CBMA 226]|uniref:hypothetical protein n=1 Tax=Mycolicibacterium sp. CBMA 226 TaxID=2606611 RepID=UPI0012DEB069|nr:hypothetical protein [Mycolicibacterium sp. CBMA 226]MUL78825.1 hypothetical protein [Mycolicibacterium sp. CBMA 226]QGW61121.1 hypothetical protein ICEMyc226_00089 [Mycolicibacterium sp.]
MPKIKTNGAITTTPRTYHLADRLRGIASDTLYREFDGVRERKPIDGYHITVHQVAHVWGRSTHVRAMTDAGQLVAEGEAETVHNIASLRSRIRTFQTGHLTWHHTDGRVVHSHTVIPSGTRFVSIGHAHYYELRSSYDLDTFNPIWHLFVDSQLQERRFAGPTGAADYVIDQYESGR